MDVARPIIAVISTVMTMIQRSLGEVKTIPEAYTRHVPTYAAPHERIVEGLAPERPSGPLVRVAIVRPEVLRYVGAWESDADFDRFAPADCIRSFV